MCLLLCTLDSNCFSWLKAKSSSAFFIKKYSLKRNVIRANEKVEKDGEAVTQLPPETIDIEKESYSSQKASESLPGIFPNQQGP